MNSLHDIINADQRSVDVMTTKVELWKFNSENSTSFALVNPVVPSTEEDYQIIRSALCRIPVPTVCVHQDFSGKNTVIHGERIISILLGAIANSSKTEERALQRRLEQTLIDVNIFRPIMSLEYAKELVSQLLGSIDERKSIDNLLTDVGALLGEFVEDGTPIRRNEARDLLQRVRLGRSNV